MFEETLYQKARDGTQFVDILRAQGIVPGIKVDTGLQVSHGQHGITVYYVMGEIGAGHLP